MSEVRKTVSRRDFLARLGAVLLPAAALFGMSSSAHAKKQSVLGKSAYSRKTPKPSTQVRHAVHMAHGFGRSSR